MFINPYQQTNDGKGCWFKANFHTHAGTGKGTCGSYEIEEVLALYKEAGYGILTISNHDLFTDTSEYQSKSELILINGFEYSQDPHMLCIGNNSVIEGPHQHVIDRCREEGGFVVLCHPNWQVKEYWPWKEIDILRGYTGIEIYNGVIFRLRGSGLATDTWDYLLSQGKPVWGFGNDDFHRWYDLSRVWNVIYTRSGQHNVIKEAILNGSFYVSTGLVLETFAFEDNIIRVVANAANTYIKCNTYRFIGKNGHILDEQYGEYGELPVSKDEMYIRIHVVSEHGAMLWTQPIYRKDCFE